MEGATDPVASVLGISELLETIFFFLSAFDLCYICRVSKTWCRIARGVLARRPKKVAFQYIENDENSGDLVNFSKDRLMVPPRYCLVFATQAMRRNFRKLSGRPAGLLVPQECEVYSVVGTGCIGTTSAGEVVENESGVGMACLYLPHGLGDLRLTPVFDSDDVGQLVQQQEPVRLLVLIHSVIGKFSGIVHQLVTACPDVVVAGGYVKQHLKYSHIARHLGIMPSSNLTANYPLAGFAISGHTVKVASVVLDCHVLSKHEISRLFVQLRNTGILAGADRERSTFAMVFSCNGRGSSQYNGQSNVEAREFMRIFPGVPLLGFYGYGEVGHLHLPKATSVVECKSQAESDRPVNKLQRLDAVPEHYLETIIRSYSSVYVLVSVAGRL